MSIAVLLILRFILSYYTAVQIIKEEDLTLQKIAQNILKLAEEVLTEVKEMSCFLELLTEMMILMQKGKRQLSFCLEKDIRKT